jgi:hypothetical protein
MAARTTETTVTFKHPFMLTALAGPQPAGTYAVETDEEEVPGLSFTAFQRTATMLRLPAIPNTGGRSEVVPVDPVELAAALQADIALLITSKGAS